MSRAGTVRAILKGMASINMFASPPTLEDARDAVDEIESDVQDELMHDQIGRCKRPSQPPGMKK